jgi:hypothetical protein
VAELVQKTGQALLWRSSCAVWFSSGYVAERLPFWKVIGEHHLAKSFLFSDFSSRLSFADRVGDLAPAARIYEIFSLVCRRLFLPESPSWIA